MDKDDKWPKTRVRKTTGRSRKRFKIAAQIEKKSKMLDFHMMGYSFNLDSEY